MKIDSLPVVPNSLTIKNIDKSEFVGKFRVNYADAQIIFDQIYTDTLIFCYRSFSGAFPVKVFHKLPPDTNILQRNYNKSRYVVDKQEDSDFFSTQEISKSGSISRGIVVGNTQDAAVNSDFNLQLSGNISPEIEISASVSDNNIPIQEDGSSNNLRDFDKVFISLKTKNAEIIAGDYTITNPEGFFLKVNKKLQGMSFETTTKSDSLFASSHKLSAAVSRGKYNRINFAGEEGNQGPYRLSGAENEAYIIILSGTEKVYINGELLQRGSDFDYTINYNSAEIIFTANKLITKDTRISVEFEYSDMSFIRYIVFFENNFKFKNTEFYLNYINESDSKNQTLAQELSDSEKQILNNSGDNISNAFAANVVETDSFSTDLILYHLTDTIVNSVFYGGIYVYSQNPERAKYIVGFSNVGVAQGNYVRELSSANGKVYKWVAPINGVKQGNYEPVKLLISPQKKQMLVAGAKYKTESTFIASEFAYSTNDLNTFSKLNDGDNVGSAVNINFNRKIIKSDSSALGLELFGNMSYNNRNFSIFEQYKNIEFNREWNVSNTDSASNELFYLIGLKMKYKSLLSSEYFFNKLIMSDIYKASGNFLKFLYENKNIGITASADRKTIQNDQYVSDFLKYNSQVRFTAGKMFFSISDLGERNIFLNNADSRIGSNSFRNNELENLVKYNFSKTNFLKITYKLREDFLPDSSKMLYSSKSDNYDLSFNFKSQRNAFVSLQGSWRSLKYSDYFSNAFDNEKSSTGKLSISKSFLKNFVNTSTLIEYGTGLESKKDYIYLEVQAGSGWFAWRDFNKNGIKELDEFVKAEYNDEASYIRIAQLSDQSEHIFNTGFAETINIRFSKLVNNKSLGGRILSAFSNSGSVVINKKNIGKFNEQNLFSNGNEIVSSNSILRNIFRFNSSDKKYVSEYSYRQVMNTSLLVNGIESKELVSNSILFQRNFKYFRLGLEGVFSTKKYESEFFSKNNFIIKNEEYKFHSVIKVLKTTDLQFRLRSSSKENIINSERAQISEIQTILNHSIGSGNVLGFDFRFAETKFSGESNSFSAYEMLEALSLGKNFIWTFTWNKNISKNLQLSVNYNGRKVSDSNTVHNGGLSLRAVF